MYTVEYAGRQGSPHDPLAAPRASPASSQHLDQQQNLRLSLSRLYDDDSPQAQCYSNDQSNHRPTAAQSSSYHTGDNGYDVSGYDKREALRGNGIGQYDQEGSQRGGPAHYGNEGSQDNQQPSHHNNHTRSSYFTSMDGGEAGYSPNPADGADGYEDVPSEPSVVRDDVNLLNDRLSEHGSSVRDDDRYGYLQHPPRNRYIATDVRGSPAGGRDVGHGGTGLLGGVGEGQGLVGRAGDGQRLLAGAGEGQGLLGGAGGGSRSGSGGSQLDAKWRNPDLREVIDFLGHSNDAVKANAAAYLQHLSYMDDNVKAQTRVLRGVPPLVALLDNPRAEVHRAACGALRNLSYGRANDDNKRELVRAGACAALARLLHHTGDTDVREVVTGILWNLSSCVDVKRAVIDDAVKMLVDEIVIPASGWNRIQGTTQQPGALADYTTTQFRNVSGVLRNVSSDGAYARRRLRECEGLVDSVLAVLRAALRRADLDSKAVENCACTLRNLSYACQEVIDPEYTTRREQALGGAAGAGEGEGNSGCFGGKKGVKGTESKVTGVKVKDASTLQPQKSHPARGMELLWQPAVVPLYLSLLDESSNPETLEAAAGAVQNLAACDWAPAIEIRAAVRKEKGLSIIVDLLGVNAERVVCAAATALRNLALDARNKELIGKYAMSKLVEKLPSAQRPAELSLSNDTICAVEATLYEVVKSSATFARSMTSEGGVERLLCVTRAPPGIYSDKVVRFAAQLLRKLWRFSELHDDFKRRGWKQVDFCPPSAANLGSLAPSSASLGLRRDSKSQPSSAENTINRTRMGQSGSSEGYDRTLVLHRPTNQNQAFSLSANQASPPPYVYGGSMASVNQGGRGYEGLGQSYDVRGGQWGGGDQYSGSDRVDSDRQPGGADQHSLFRGSERGQSPGNVLGGVESYGGAHHPPEYRGESELHVPQYEGEGPPRYDDPPGAPTARSYDRLPPHPSNSHRYPLDQYNPVGAGEVSQGALYDSSLGYHSNDKHQGETHLKQGAYPPREGAYTPVIDLYPGEHINVAYSHSSSGDAYVGYRRGQSGVGGPEPHVGADLHTMYDPHRADRYGHQSSSSYRSHDLSYRLEDMSLTGGSVALGEGGLGVGGLGGERGLEPLYAKVNKQDRYGEVSVEGEEGGVRGVTIDSWV